MDDLCCEIKILILDLMVKTFWKFRGRIIIASWKSWMEIISKDISNF